MRKFLLSLLAITMILSTVACSKEPSETTGVKDGVYSGTGTGHGGNVVVEVEIKEEKITAVTVKEHAETAGISDPALNTLPEAIVKHQSIGIDAVSGATETSLAIFEAVENALKEAGADVEKYKKAVVVDAPAETIEKEVDIVVVGGGVAGLTAAIEASIDGANVLLIEKLAALGGSTALSEGRILAADSYLQREQGIVDTPEQFAQFMINLGDGLVNEEKLNWLANNSGPNIDWLVEQGVVFSDQITTPNPAMTPNRGLVVEGATGINLIKPLESKAKEQGVEILLETTGKELLVEDGVVVGIKAEQGNDTLMIHADAVILATGGYDRNQELVKQYSPTYAGSQTNVGAGNTGDGLIMAREVGANIQANDSAIAQILPFGSALWDLFAYSGLYVSVTGERFMDESYPRPVRTPIVLRQTNANQFFIILDSKNETDGVLAAVDEGSAYVADTLEDLAAQTGMDPEKLVASVERYNQLCTLGVDEDFGKSIDLMVPVNEGKYYAVRCTMNTAGTFGGPEINMKAEVINTEGNAIAGLYAAGEVATGDLMNKEYAGSGMSIANCVNTGRAAGQNALAYSKTK